MTQLKTLKDIVPDLSEAGVILRELREEAIKWIMSITVGNFDMTIPTEIVTKQDKKHLNKQ